MLTVAAFCLAAMATTSDAANAGKRAAALDNADWNNSEWISAANAPVVTGKIEGRNERAADGSSWFVANVKNDKKVVSARWMTAGLGVYQLYVNGKQIGDEVLKPGFTHYAKTKRSFTYDVTDAFAVKAGAENTLAVQVTPGWWADKIITPGGNDGMIGKWCARTHICRWLEAAVRNQYPRLESRCCRSGEACCHFRRRGVRCACGSWLQDS